MSIATWGTNRTQDQKLREAFSKIREELEEHLQSINENAQELAHNHQYIAELESKMAKLSERLDSMQLFLRQAGFEGSAPSYTIRPLTNEEKRVFLCIYALEDERGHVTYADIANALSIEPALAAGFVASVAEKGVPIVKRYVNDIAFLRLDSDFKQLQAKENVIGLDRAQKVLVEF